MYFSWSDAETGALAVVALVLVLTAVVRRRRAAEMPPAFSALADFVFIVIIDLASGHNLARTPLCHYTLLANH